MENDQTIINQYEGIKIKEVIWPFHRFNALIPNQIGGDIFVWLYLSLVVYINENKNLPKDNYSRDSILEAQNIINKKFSNVIDPQTLTKVVSNAEKDYVLGKKKIKESTFLFLDTYESLFSESCETRMVYQDAITGEVLPFFGDTSNIEDCFGDCFDKFHKHNYKKPSGKSIKKAYSQYIKLKQFNAVSEETEPELEDEFVDEDEQTFLGDESEDVFAQKKKELKSLNARDVIPVDGTDVDINVLVSLYIKDNSVVASSPFGPLTDTWFNKCLQKARSVSADVDNAIKNYEEIYCIPKTNIKYYIESHKDDFASSLTYCQTLYRIINSLGDDGMRENVAHLDIYMKQDDPSCYIYAGKIIDSLMKKICSEREGIKGRDDIDIKTWYALIDKKCENASVKYQFLKSKNIYDQWKKKFSRRDRLPYYHFQAYLVDIILDTNIIASPSMYSSFFDDLVSVYKLRNAFSHDEKIDVNPETIDKLTKAIRVLFELI